ncbi:ABC transporter permease [Paenibacillus durus]|uniref:ABC transporter permease n=1 Tax=Paenibacillus durus TaxID=44251 RepID=A0A089HMU7_PAEDU|nr:ABC-2 family transporter protein [Paenibacillus durus]AIQ12040.1 ABC transporter permease [Paenibacillus durus]
MNVSVKLRKYRAVSRITVKNQFMYVMDLLVRTLFLLIILYIFIQLWTATYAGAGETVIGGYRFEELIWYLIFSESLVTAMPKLHITVEDEVKTGGIGYLLCRPVSYILYRYAEFAGEFAVRLVVNLLVGGALGLALFGLPGFGWGWLGFVPVAAAAVTLNFMIRMMLALCAFWVEEIQGLVFVYDKLLFTVGGMLLPLELFIEPFRSICRWLPFQTMIYFPVKTAVQFEAGRMLQMLGIQAAWGLVFGLLLSLVYRRGVNKLNVNGG